MQHRHRDPRAVMALGQQPAADIGSLIMARRDFLFLAQEPGAGAHIVIEYPGRRGRRGIGKPQNIRLELVAGHQRQVIGFLVEGDVVLGAVRKRPHHDPRQGLFEFQADQPVTEQDDGTYQTARLVRDEVAPIGRIGIIRRRRGNAKIDRIPVGEDNQRLSVIRYVVCDPSFSGH